MDFAFANLSKVPGSRHTAPFASRATNMETARISVFLVEDSRPIRVRLTDMLTAIGNVAVVGNADTPDSAIEGISRTHPDCVVLDLQLSGGSGIDVLRKVRPAERSTVFIVLTNHVDPQYREICMQNGASYFFDKSSEFERVKEVIAGLGARH